MGRKTWEEIKNINFNNRIPIVISKTLKDNVKVFSNLNEFYNYYN